MSVDEQVSEHDIWAVLGEIVDLVSQIDDPPADVSAELVRISAVASTAADIRTNVPSELIPLGVLKAMMPNATSARSQLSSAISQAQEPQKATHIRNAETQIDNLATASGWLMPYSHNAVAPSPSTVTAAQRAIASIQEKADGFEQRITELEGELAAKVEAEADRASTAATEAKSRLDLVTEQVGDLGTRISEDEGRLDKEIARQQQAFATAQQDRDKAWLAEKGDALSTLADDATTRIEKIETAANGSLEKVKNAETEAQELVGSISVGALANGYEQDANEDTIVQRIWQGAVLASTVGAVCTAIWAFGDADIDGDFQADRFLARAVVVALLTAFATYSARQAGVHRDRATWSRGMQRQLQSFGPYIESLPKNQREELRAQQTSRFFPVIAAPSPAKGDDRFGSAGSITDAAKKAASD